MRLIRAEIYGFGHVSNVSYDFQENGITILYGPNESGKTTIMECIRSILYGFESSKHRLRYEPVNGGIFGGKLTFSLDPMVDKRGFSIERVFNGRSLRGEVTVVDVDGEVLGSEEYVQNALHYLAPQVYKTIFSFGLTELEDLHSLSEADIQARIHSAGMGMKSRSPIELERSLETKRVGLYRKRGQEQPISKRIREKQALKKKLQQLADMPKRYLELQAQSQQLRDSLNELYQQRNQVDSILETIAVHKAVRELWEEVIPYERSLQSFPDVPVCSPAQYAKWQELRTEQIRFEQQIQELCARLKSFDEVLASLLDHDEWVSNRQAITELYENKSSMVEAYERTKQVSLEINQLEQRLQETMDRLGNQIDADALKRISIALSEYERIRTFQELYQDLGGQMSHLTTQLEKLEEELEQTDLQLAELVDQIQQKGPIKPIALEQIQKEEFEIERLRKQVYELDAYQQGLRDAQQRYDDTYEQMRQSRSDLLTRKDQGSNQSNGYRKQMTGLGAVILFLLVVAWLWPQQRMQILVSDGTLTVGFLSWILWNAGSSRSVRHMGRSSNDRTFREPYEMILQSFEKEIKNRSNQVEQVSLELMNSAQAIGIVLNSQDTQYMLQRLQQHANKLQAFKDQMLDVNRFIEKKLELKQQRQRILRVYEKKQAAVQDVMQKQEEWFSSWKIWLASNSMPLTLLPENAYVFMQTVERAREQLYELQRKKQEHSELKQKVTLYIERVDGVAKTLGAEATNLNWYVTIQNLFDDLLQRLKDKQQKEQIGQQQSELLQQKQALADTYEANQKRMEQWLTANGFREPAEVIQSYESSSKRRELEQQLQVLYAKIEAKVGSSRKLSESIEAAKQHDITTWERQLGDAEQERIRVVEKIEESRRMQGKLELELEQFEQATEQSDVLHQLATVETELQELAQQWAVYTLTQKLLEQARKTYELERQPAVLKQASAWFRSITEERYQKVISPFGSEILDVLSAGQIQLPTTSLSRGTAEQLYLTMRFALLEELFEKGILAPVILDDVFVNFDSNRLLSTLRVLDDVANRHQVLYFTCHRHIVDCVRSNIRTFEVVNI